MALPPPEPGLVISYAYLWRREYEAGRDEGVKDRPCVVVLSVEVDDGQTVVTVVPVTHAEPRHMAEIVELPLATKRRLGLDDALSWVVVSEVNRFVWPGPDLRPITTNRFEYGVLPHNLFRQIRDRLVAAAARQRLSIVPRTE